MDFEKLGIIPKEKAEKRSVLIMKIYEAIIITEGEVKKQYLFAEGTRSASNYCIK